MDERAKVAAISEYRHLSESFRKLTGVDVGGSGAAVPQDAATIAQYRELVEWAKELAPRVVEYESRISVLEHENRELKRELERWQSGDYAVAELMP